MRMLLKLLFVFSILFLIQDTFADVRPALVRIRMFKDLADFPDAPYSQFRQLGNNLWSLSGENIKMYSKFLPFNNFIVRKPNGHFDVISILQFNEYLAGVVGSEMPVSWPLEALKAQAVVARSYALARIKERNSKSFHLDSDQNDQVYLMSNSQKTRLAVLQTDGVVLRGPNGNILKAFYHSDCGGETVRATDVWGVNEVDSGTAKDPWCAAKRSNQWSFEIARDEFLQKADIRDIEPQSKLLNNKPQLLAFGGVLFSIQKLRELFGFLRIRSSINSIEITDEKVRFTGQGFGHGAGLCQWGTLSQVRMGKTYLEILAHYYPKAKLVQDSALILSLNLPLNSSRNTVSN